MALDWLGAEHIGLAFEPGKSKYRHGFLDLKIAQPDNPIVRGLPLSIHFCDETYWPMFPPEPGRARGKMELLATTEEEGKDWPMLWTITYPGTVTADHPGRIFCSVLGHYAWTYDSPWFRIMLLRGLAWAAGEDLHRFEPLVTQGLNLKP